MNVEIPTVFTPLRHRAVVRARRRRRGFGGPLPLTPRVETGEAFGLRQSSGVFVFGSISESPVVNSKCTTTLCAIHN